MESFFRRLRSADQDVLTNPNLVFDNIMHFASAASQLGWKGPVVLMSDCTKVRPKAVYSSELGQIVGSVLSNEEVRVNSYDDIHRIMSSIKESRSIATQVHTFLLKVSNNDNYQMDIQVTLSYCRFLWEKFHLL
jgi:hypothetical protein